jgi:hypothetical protein
MTRIHIPTEFRRLVIERARACCEYCLLHQDHTQFTHQVDHIIAIKHGGLTLLENLALACLECNLNKGADLATLLSGILVALFNPRKQNWQEHFALNQELIVGITPTGFATINLLQINHPRRTTERRRLIALGVYPPQWIL